MKPRGKTAANEIARVQKLGAKCFSFKVNQKSRTLYSHDDAGTFTNRRLALNALLCLQHPHSTQSVVDSDDVAIVESDSSDEVLLLDPEPETEITLSADESDFAEWSVGACGDSDSDVDGAWWIKDANETSVPDDLLMLSASDLL